MNQTEGRIEVKGTRLLLLVAGSVRCALPLAAVVETMRPLPVRVLPDAPDFVSGVARVRGEPLPVVDLGLLLGSSNGCPQRWVVVRAGQRKAALGVDEVTGIRTPPAGALTDLPPLLSKAKDDLVTNLGTLDRELFLLLQAARLVPEEVWTILAQTADAPATHTAQPQPYDAS